MFVEFLVAEPCIVQAENKELLHRVFGSHGLIEWGNGCSEFQVMHKHISLQMVHIPMHIAFLIYYILLYQLQRSGKLIVFL